MAIDPGETTGLAWGLFDLDAGDEVADVLIAGSGLGSGQVRGKGRRGERWAAANIVEMWREHISVSGDVQAVVCIEDFLLRPGKATADRAMLSPVRLTGLVEGILLGEVGGPGVGYGRRRWEADVIERGPEIVYQQPSAAKRFGNDDRLRRWGLWTVGERHSRDAWRHVALWLATNM